MFNFFRRTNKKQSKKKNELFTNSVNAFHYRKIYKNLSKEDFDTISDDNLIQAIFDNISANISEDEYESVKRLNESQQAIYKIWLLESEINNGGFNQFYYNSSGRFYNELPESLKIIGANKFAELLGNANRVYENNYDFITSLQNGTLDGFSKSYKDNPLDEFDCKFSELYSEENIEKLQIHYIKTHINDFINC